MTQKKSQLKYLKKSSGFSVLELMVALLIGMIIIASFLSVFISNKKSSGTNQALTNIQEGSRTAFEFISRDVKGAGFIGCGNNANRVGSILNNGPTANGTTWWADWSNSFVGYDNAKDDPAIAAGVALEGTSSIQIIGSSPEMYSVKDHDNSTETKMIEINESGVNIVKGDVLVICNPDHATIFQANGFEDNFVLLNPNDKSVLPNNCSSSLGYPSSCETIDNIYTFGKNSQISKLSATNWYVGPNKVGGNSLYRTILSADSNGAASPTAQEIARNVSDMKIEYLSRGQNSFTNAESVSNWGDVVAVRIAIRFKVNSSELGGNESGDDLNRTLVTTINLRNRT